MPDAPDPHEALRRFLGGWAPMTRAEALHLALQTLRNRVEPDRVLACEFAWEVHAKGYWSQVRNPDGTVYLTEEAYFRDVLGLASWRTAYKRLAVGRMLITFRSQRLLEPGPQSRWDRLPHRGGLLPGCLGARLLAHGLQALGRGPDADNFQIAKATGARSAIPMGPSTSPRRPTSGMSWGSPPGARLTSAWPWAGC